MIFLALKSQKKWLSCELDFTRIQLYCRSWKGCAKSLKYFSGPAIFDGLAHFYSQDVNWLVDLEYDKARKMIYHIMQYFSPNLNILIVLLIKEIEWFSHNRRQISATSLYQDLIRVTCIRKTYRISYKIE